MENGRLRDFEIERGQVKDFKDVQIWQKAIELFKMSVSDIKNFPQNRISYSVSDQFFRSTSSISANIAEGYGRDGDQELHRFCQIAKGSLDESKDWVYKLLILSYIKQERAEEYELKLEELRRMLNSFVSQIRKRVSSKKSLGLKVSKS